MMHRHVVVALSLIAAASTAACDDGAATAATTPLDPVVVVADDYVFEDVPSTLPVGTELALRNASMREFHELVLLRIDPAETRPVSELVALPPDEAEQVTTLVGVATAFPGEDGDVVEGDLVLDEAGRYALVCFVPTGADPEAYRAATDGPPQVDGGPPHAMHGMVAEIVAA